MSSRGRLVFAAIGLAQGAVFFVAHEHWPATSGGRALAMACVFFAAVAGLTAQLCWTGRDGRRLAALALGLATPFALVAAWVWAQVPVEGAAFYGDDSRIWTWAPAAFVCLYVLMPFAQIYQRDGRLAFPYRDLFFHAWTNVFIGALGQVYLTVFTALIHLWGGLFDLIGIDVFSKIFSADWFLYSSCPTVFGYGLFTGRENARFPEAGRSAVLAVFRFLMPLLAVIELIFLAALPFTGLAALWSTGHASALLLGLSSFVVLFVNAVYEDGETAAPCPPALRRLTEAALAALPLILAIAAYSLWLRVAQHGLSPERIYALVFCALSGAFALGYASALFRRGPWLGGIRRVNVALSLTVVAIGFALHTPLADPLRWSARSQVARLLAGQVAVADFDFASLRFHLGHAGDDALARLAAADHPEREAIATGIHDAREATHYELKPALDHRIRDEDVRVLGSLATVPDGFTAFLAGANDPGLRGQCYSAAPCTLFAVDLDADGSDEHCLVTAPSGDISWNPTRCYARTSSGWRAIGTLSGGAGSVDVGELRAHGAGPMEPRFRDVRVGDHTYRLVPTPVVSGVAPSD
jgi:uncharacterized protein DUF4153